MISKIIFYHKKSEYIEKMLKFDRRPINPLTTPEPLYKIFFVIINFIVNSLVSKLYTKILNLGQPVYKNGPHFVSTANFNSEHGLKCSPGCPLQEKSRLRGSSGGGGGILFYIICRTMKISFSHSLQPEILVKSQHHDHLKTHKNVENHIAGVKITRTYFS